MSLLDDLMDGLEDDAPILRAPFGYPGGKSRSVRHILPLLPYRNIYVEPFGGSGAVILARRPSPVEVFNDRYAGVVAFYRVIRDPVKLKSLCERLELTVHAREEWLYAKQTWKNCADDVERAALWYYMTYYSFACLGRHFGRATTSSALAGKIHNKLKYFHTIHNRFRTIQVENQDWRRCIHDYDNEEAVFYLDPPYLAVHEGAYSHTMTHDDHRELLVTIFNMKAFVAISGYSNPLYENQPWDSRHEWESHVSLTPAGDIKANRKEHLVPVTKRERAAEVLWIKESQ